MAQYIRVPTTFNEAYDMGLQQVSQIIYHLERTIEICWQPALSRVLIQDNGQWFYLYSPDIHQMTLKQAIVGLGYGDEQIKVVWALDDLQDEVLLMSVQNAPLNQLAIYAAGAEIPNEPPQGHFPQTVNTPVIPLVDSQNTTVQVLIPGVNL
jgi:hypothetical protein